MDKDVLVQYYCVLVDKYIGASRTRNYQQHNKIDLLVRGSLTIRGFNYLTRGLQPAEGLIALSDAQGNVRWDNLRIPTLNISSTYALLDRWYYILIMCIFSNTWSRGKHISIPLLGRIFLQEALMHQSFLKIRRIEFGY
jgi:hypothetical protein